MVEKKKNFNGNNMKNVAQKNANSSHGKGP
jgi:hypothetical protein